MKTLPASDLPELPSQVKSLVRNGVYALYSLGAETEHGGRFLLMTSGQAEFYVLSATGAVVSAGGKNASAFEVEAAMTFGGAGDTIRINLS